LRSAKAGDADANLTGRGKLDIAGATEAKVASGTPPKVNLESLTPAYAGGDAKLRVSAEDDDTSGLFARWDLDYDGTFDTDWLPLGEQAIPLADAALGAKIGVKVEVRDSQGNLNGATTTIEVVPPAPVADPGSGAAADEGCLCRSTGGAPTGRTRAIVGGALALALAFARRARRGRSD
ncbi:MAG: peptidase and in, kexin, sedolisin, partial [Labilithrix sp.]|nr:peptidase and in, kexin, sedolisin [Labilithrix sp.]